MKRHKGPCAREPAYRQCPNQAASDDQELFRQQRLDDPHWEGKQLRVAVGRAVQTHDGMTVVFSVLNSSSRTIELLPPQIQLAGKSKDQHSKTIKAEPMAIKDYRLTARRRVRGRTELSSSNVQALRNPESDCCSKLRKRKRWIGLSSCRSRLWPQQKERQSDLSKWTER